MDVDEYMTLGRAKPAQIPQTWPVYAYTPRPALVTEVGDTNALIHGAWAWTHRHVAGLKIGKDKAKMAFFCKAEDRKAAIEICAEKAIPPAAWFAWILCKRQPAGIVTLQALINLPWLATGAKRNWFRKEAAHLFGGRAVVVGRPPHRDAPAEDWAMYRQAAESMRMAEDARMLTRSHHGELFPNADIRETLMGEPR